MAGTLRAEATLAAANLVYILLLVGGAVVVPLTSYPSGVRDLVTLLPSGALAEGLREALGGGGVHADRSHARAPRLGDHRDGRRDAVLPMGVTHRVTASRETAPPARSRVRNLVRPPGRTTMRRLAAASLVANIVLVVTGGAVRLTGSGLGCPTWPRCTSASFVAHDALGIHGFIEFSNRMLTIVLVVVAVATWVAAMRLRPARRSIKLLASALLLGIPVQAVIGGVSVLSDLNPWVVSFHLLASLALVAVAVVLVRRVDEEDRRPRRTVPWPVVLLARGMYVAMW